MEGELRREPPYATQQLVSQKGASAYSNSLERISPFRISWSFGRRCRSTETGKSSQGPRGPRQFTRPETKPFEANSQRSRVRAGPKFKGGARIRNPKLKINGPIRT